MFVIVTNGDHVNNGEPDGSFGPENFYCTTSNVDDLSYIFNYI